MTVPVPNLPDRHNPGTEDAPGPDTGPEAPPRRFFRLLLVCLLAAGVSAAVAGFFAATLCLTLCVTLHSCTEQTRRTDVPYSYEPGAARPR